MPKSLQSRGLHSIQSGATWTIPAGMVIGAALLAGICLRLDQQLQISPRPDRIWLYAGGPDGASSVLSAIAGSTITVAGVIFSVQFVVLQLASSQYTPRVIRSLAKRYDLLAVLGTFLGTFVFSLLVLRSVRTASPGHPEFVPVISTTVAIILSLLSVAVLIYFVHFGTKLVQPGSLFTSAMQDTIRLLTEPLQGEPVDILTMTEPPSAQTGVLLAARTGYIQSLNIERVGDVEPAAGARVRFDRPVGSFVMTGEPVGVAWSDLAFDADTLAAIAASYTIGEERTPEQDIEFGFQRLADIALKALSPAINDPTTALGCIDGLCAGLVLVAEDFATPHRYRMGMVSGPAGTTEIIWNGQSFENCLDIAFSQIRLYGAADPMVMSHLIVMLGRVANQVGSQFRPALVATAEQVHASALGAASQPTDRARIDAVAAWFEGTATESAPLHQA